MSTQLAPEVSQRRHWYVYEIGDVPDHVPDVALSVAPTVGWPKTVGGDVLDGAFAAAVTYCALIAIDRCRGVAVPNELDGPSAYTSNAVRWSNELVPSKE